MSKKQLGLALASLILLFIIGGLLTFFYESEITRFTQGIAQYFGFGGLAALVIISDVIASPIPPDAILFILAKSHLHNDWLLYISILSFCSVLAGHIGYFLGSLLVKYNWAPKFVVSYANKNKDFVSKYGKWAVVIGALTPFPFSITCWAAGMLKVKLSHFFWAACFRIPRIFITYLFICNSTNFAEWLRSIL